MFSSMHQSDMTTLVRYADNIASDYVIVSNFWLVMENGLCIMICKMVV